MPYTLHSKTQLSRDYLLRLLETTDAVAYFGPNSVAAAHGEGVASAAMVGEAHGEENFRRSFLKPATGEPLLEQAEQLGVPAAFAERSGVYVVAVPEISTVTSITGAGPYTINFTGFQSWQTGDSFKIRGATDEETLTVASTPTATSVTVATMTLSATFNADIGAGDVVRMLFRATIAADSIVTAQGSVTFGTIAALTTGDSNAIFGGEATALSLCDKVWCECTSTGTGGNIARMSITGLQTPVRGVNRLFNPLPAIGGKNAPTDSQIKYAVAHNANALAKSTARGVEALARQVNPRVVRAFTAQGQGINLITVKALPSNVVTPLTANEKSDLAAVMVEYSPPGINYSFEDVTMVAIDIVASVTMVTGPSGESASARKARLRSIYNRVVSNVADYLDAGRWVLGVDVSRSKLLKLVTDDKDVSTVDTLTFEPLADVSIGSEELPMLVSFSLTDSSNGYTWGDDLTMVYPI